MTRPVITPLPPVPSRQDPSTFADKADVFVAALPDFSDDLDALADYLELEADDAAASATAAAASETNVAASAAAASTSEANAAASAVAAASSSNVSAWSAGNYSQNDSAISQVDFQTYRAKTTHTSSVDPSSDPTNWVRTSTEGLRFNSTSGATQQIDFKGPGVHNSSANTSVVTYTFSAPNSANTPVKVDLIIDPATIPTAFDVSTASYSGNSFSVSSQNNEPRGLAFNSDGTKMFVTGTLSVYEYDLSTGFDVSTASYSSNSFSVSSQDSSPYQIAFNSDGTKMFVLGRGTLSVYEYNLSTGFDVSTASYSSNSLSVISQTTSPRGLAFNSDGTKMFVIGVNPDTVYEYNLSTGFDVSTASYSSNSFSVSSQSTGPFGLAFNSDGTKMFVLDFSTDAVYEYNLASLPTLVFPTMESPAIPLQENQKTALSIVTSDGGASYQVISVQGGIV